MSKRILIVEDQEDLRAILRDLLTGSGYTIIEAVDGGAGVEKAQGERPDLILMDIQLPILDGYEAMRRIRSDPSLEKTRPPASPPTRSGKATARPATKATARSAKKSGAAAAKSAKTRTKKGVSRTVSRAAKRAPAKKKARR